MNPDNQDEWIGVSVFESKQAHIDNANSPETNEMYESVIQHLETEPTWPDGNFLITNI